jgi:integrase/recombinase XerD
MTALEDILKRLSPDVQPETVSVYARHASNCPKRDDKDWKRCNCTKSLYVFQGGRDFRFSAKTRSWEKAENLKDEIEDSFDPVKNELRKLKEAQQAKRTAITVAVDAFLADAKTRNLASETQSKLRTLFANKLASWAQQNGLVHLDEVNTQNLREWRSTWELAPLTTRNRQESLRTFFRFCIHQGWLKDNPASGLSRIKVKHKPTDYFRPEEFDKIIATTYSFGKGSKNPDAANYGVRIRTLLLLMRFSGLRIGDAVTLQRSRLTGDNLLLHQAKTGEPVFVPLLHEVAEALRQVPAGRNPDPRYFFWNGICKVKSLVTVWEKSLRGLFKSADIRNPDGSQKRCHPHMLRDTFAVEMLLADVPIEDVSVLLGHTSIKTTEKHYLPWVRARQQRLEEKVRNALQKQRIPVHARKFAAGVGISTNGSEDLLQSPVSKQENHITPIVDDQTAGSGVLLLPIRSGSPTSSHEVRELLLHEDAQENKEQKHRRFPYILVAKMWAQGKTPKEIAAAIGRLGDELDPTHQVRPFLTRMHVVGYKDETGKRIKLPYRNSSERKTPNGALDTFDSSNSANQNGTGGA